MDWLRILTARDAARLRKRCCTECGSVSATSAAACAQPATALTQSSMASAELLTFESYCETLYSSPSASERASAESALVQLSTAPEYIPRCQYVLSASQLPYAQLVASNALRCVPCTVQTRV